MQSIQKKFSIILASIIFALLIPINCFADNADYRNTDTGYSIVIEDDADLLTASEEKRLLAVMEPITEYSNVAFHTTDYDSYSTVEAYAGKYLNNLFGRGADATVFIIDMDKRKVCVYSDGATLNIVTRDYADTITDNIYSYASSGDYYSAAVEVFSQIDTLLKGGKIAQPMKYICNFLLAIIFAIFVNYFIVTQSSKAKKATNAELLIYADKKYSNSPATAYLTYTSKVYNPPSSSSSGGSSGGGGGSSGGGGSHSF